MKDETEYIPLDDYQHYAYISDLDVSSMLLAQDYDLVSLDKTTQNKIVFIFKKNKYLEDAIDDFLSGKLSVNALAFSNARKNLKSRIYAQRTIDY